jgi:hypothetical protein
MPTAVPLAHRFYGQLEYLTNQLTNLGFEILKAESRPPDPAHISEMKFIHGNNVIYAKKSAAEN